MANQNSVAEPETFDVLAGPDIEEPVIWEEPKPRIFEDPTMDPGSPRWNPRKYFSAQPRVVIVVQRNESDILSDPGGDRKVTIPVSINGFELPGGITKGVPTRVPRDFADFLVEIGAAYRYADIPDAMSL